LYISAVDGLASLAIFMGTSLNHTVNWILGR
jgi:hypothetical protein